MFIKSIITLSTLAVFATATPWGAPSSSSTWGTPKPTSKPTPTSTWGTPKPTKTTPAASPSPTGGFINQCENFGISILDCTQLGNIAALNGNTITVGGSGSSPTPVNNGAPFLNQCKNYGISIADCAQILNLSILNGNSIDIDLASLTSLLASLGLSNLLPGLLGGILSGGLIPIPANVL